LTTYTVCYVVEQKAEDVLRGAANCFIIFMSTSLITVQLSADRKIDISFTRVLKLHTAVYRMPQFWPKFRFFGKTSIFDWNYDFRSKFL